MGIGYWVSGTGLLLSVNTQRQIPNTQYLVPNYFIRLLEAPGFDKIACVM
jgi:hypothetical protein